MNQQSSLSAYDFQRSEATNGEFESMDHASVADSESYLAIHTMAGSSSMTGHYHSTSHADATDTIHEMHLALLYLLSNPEEFQKALATHPARGATTLEQWNAEYDNESLTEAESVAFHEPKATSTATPLPFVVFADDAEVVLPQAHTASQLFGIERLEGIELEAAAGISSISQLFLRWLALMPGGDHLNIIDPPGLTVMRIAGGRYRVTAAHRVVWTWMNEFAPLSEHRHGPKQSHSNDEFVNQLQIGDLVTMTIVDVFETDNQGKLLSYCPTFDNRAVYKTHQTTETLRRGGSHLMSMLGKARNSQTAETIFRNAKVVAQTVTKKVGDAVTTYSNNKSPARLNTCTTQRSSTDSQDLRFDSMSTTQNNSSFAQPPSVTSSSYIADDDMERHEV
ncbi:hypothetical protein FisN_3Lh537 [Fistulifera solaris]|uniref:Uncharacterized protein n=1 Tax=Fistulifera solaris TaxID=1519565 RepID=A0A1Z5J8K8_FISSO|nr:hypothetical protein FisN_3Lh537 [Fistulifera solaris]|eukprot:GAX10330.1 hypothetical protein FisN_3Lh537 [Fistulifera solaris]